MLRVAAARGGVNETLLLMLLVALVGGRNSSHARTWTVTDDGLGDAPSIRAAVDSASAIGDTIYVAPGDYFESGIVISKSLVITGTVASPFPVIDGSFAHTAIFDVRNVPDPGLFVSYLHLRNARDGIGMDNANGTDGTIRAVSVVFEGFRDGRAFFLNHFNQKIGKGYLDHCTIVDCRIGLSPNDANVLEATNTVISGCEFATHGHRLNSFTLDCVVLWDNDVLYGHTQPPVVTNDVHSDPLFCDAGNGNYQLQRSSPCLPDNNHTECGETIGALGMCASTSSDPAHAYPIVGALQDQIAQINGGPPPYPNGWQPVVRQADNHARTTHVCYESLGITGADPAVEFTVPPSDLRLGKWESSTSIRVFNEQIRTAVSTLVPVNQSFRGCGTEEVELSDFTEALGAVPPGTAVNSHLLHFDPLGQANVTMTGRVYFDSPIVGVIGSPLLLDQTDALFGHPGVEHYATGQADRGPENGPVDYVTVGADRRSLFVHLVAENKMDEIRVLTAGSADPIQQPYVDVDSYMVNIDEVSLDNCSSAFYRFEFELPDNFNAPSLVGQANADDVAVVYLNGTRISPALLNSDTWGVDRNEGGMALISAPTLDSFTASASSLFLPGTNELAFGVLGDACDSDPTGLEFSAQVNYGLPASSAVSVTSAAPAHIGLSLPSPNPGRAFGFALGLSVREHVAIRVHDALGRVVDVVARDQLDPGVHEFEWRPHASMANGVYFIEAQGSGGVKSVRRLLLLR